MAAKFKIGVIGSGMISESHLKNYAADPRVEVVWVADLIEERAKRRAEQFKVKRALTDYRAGLGDVDGVSVCTPPFAHRAPTEDAAAAGKHVLVEKPMAMTAAESRAMADACARAGVVLGLCSARASLNLAVETARGLVSAGKLGPVYYSRVTNMRRRGRPGLDFWPDVTWFLSLEKAGGGAIMDIGCYDIDVLMYILGAPQPVSVSAVHAREIGSQRAPAGVTHDVEEHVTLLVRFADGSAASFETAWAVNLDNEKESAFLLFGKTGGLRLKPLTLYGEDRKHKPTATPLAPRQRKFESLQGDFVSACLGTKPTKQPNTPGAVGVKIMQIIEGALRSAKAGREVKVEEL